MKWLNKPPTADADGYYATGLTAETLQIDVMHPLKLADTAIILTQLGDEIIAFSAHCPHAAANLKDGELHRGRVICPDHDWEFDVRTGRTVWPADEPCRLKRYPTRLVDNYIFVQIQI